MATTTDATPETDKTDTTILSAAHGAALDYAEHGWPVLPGSTWNGSRYVISGPNKVTDGVRPTVPRNYATTDPATITGWWSADGRLVPTVLLRSGLAFDVFSVARPLAESVIQTRQFRSDAGPVVYRPDNGRAYFMVTPGVIPAQGFGGQPGEIILLKSGSWFLVPPARMGIGVNVTWWSAPSAVAWNTTKFDLVRDLLRFAATNRSDLSLTP